MQQYVLRLSGCSSNDFKHFFIFFFIKDIIELLSKLSFLILRVCIKYEQKFLCSFFYFYYIFLFIFFLFSFYIYFFYFYIFFYIFFIIFSFYIYFFSFYIFNCGGKVLNRFCFLFLTFIIFRNMNNAKKNFLVNILILFENREAQAQFRSLQRSCNPSG